MMIVPDTSVLFGLGPDAPAWDLLRALKLSGRHQVAIPWMVREELVARRVRDHQLAHAGTLSAQRELTRCAPWLAIPAAPAFERNRARTYWRSELAALFEILPTSGDVARQALAREAYAEKPAKTGDGKALKKGGARDAAIWLTVVEHLRRNPDERVCFVSANTHDFGDGRSYPPPMDTDIEGLEQRLLHLTSLDALLDRVARPLHAHHTDAPEHLDTLLTAPRVLAAMRAEAERLLTGPHQMWTGTDLGTIDAPRGADTRQVRWNQWATVPVVVLHQATDIAGHDIDGEHWYTATVDWFLLGVAMRSRSHFAPDSSAMRRIACAWRTRLLFSSRPGVTPTVLRHWPAAGLPDKARPRWEQVLAEHGAAVPDATQVSLWAIEQLARGLGEMLGAGAG